MTTFAGLVIPAVAATNDPSLKLVAVDDSLVVASLKNFPATADISVVATVEGGSGTTTARSSGSGRVMVGFELPDGYSGTVSVKASSGSTSKTASVAIGDDDTSSTSAPATSAPTTSSPTTAAPTTSSTSTSVVKAPTTSTTKPAGSTGSTIKLMAIGDSVTQDGGTGAYRQSLYEQLNAIPGTKWDFVGSQKDSSGLTKVGEHAIVDPDHEGYSGWTNAQMAAKATGWVSAAKPDVVLLHAGTNDMLQGHSANQAITDLRSVINNIYKGKADTHVIVAGIIPITDDRAGALPAYEAAIPKLVAEFEAQGKSISYVDLSKSVTKADLGDDVHPNPAGKQKMADAWFPAVKAWAASR